MRYLLVAVGIGVMLAASARAQGDKPNFSGSWQVNPIHTKASGERPLLMWVKIEQKGDTIHLARGLRMPDGKEAVTEVRCSTKGEDCNVDATTKVTFYYLGDTLKEIEMAGETLIKRAYTLETEGRLTVEVRYVTPGATTDSFGFDKTSPGPVTF